MAGLYIHIPFCHSKCAYCDFYSRPSLRWADDYIEALLREWSVRRTELSEPVTTLYIGGGTPSLLPVELLSRLLDGLDIGNMNLTEFTVEANPEDVTPQWVHALTPMSVNRISMGVQSLVDNELVLVGRRHSAAQAIDSITAIRRGGIDNLSCDLIYGLPGQSLESWQYSLDALLSQGIKHLSAYMLSYEPGTRLYTKRLAGKITETSEDTLTAMYDILIRTAASHGMEHYEISNFGLPGFHSRHNSGYWDSTPYLGLGASAHSFDGVVRRYNPSDIKLYMAHPHNSFVTETPSPDSVHNDHIITSLRTVYGIDTSTFTADELRILRKYVHKGIMQPLSTGRYRISESGWLLADAVMTDFMRVSD